MNKIENYNGVEIHFIKAKKSFKKIACKVLIRNPYSIDLATKLMILSDILVENCKDHPKHNLLKAELEERYNTSIGNDTEQVGDQLFTTFTFLSLNPKYTEKEELEKVIKLFFSIIYKPNVENFEFDKTTFDSAINVYRSRILSLKEKKRTYAINRFNHFLDETSLEGLEVEEALKMLSKLTPKNLFETYQELIKGDTKIYFSGDINSDKVINIIKNNIVTEDHLVLSSPNRIKINREFNAKEIKETTNTQQSLLIVEYAYPEELSHKEEIYVANVLADILGGQNSLLFNDIREKQSLCYQISAENDYFKKDLVIYTAINSKNYKLVLESIENNINKLKNGKFSKNMVKNSSKMIISNLKANQESITGSINEYVNQHVIKIDSLKNRISEYRNVTKKDVVNLSRKLELNLIYLLKEDQDGKKNN